jgi:hypothetical protein
LTIYKSFCDADYNLTVEREKGKEECLLSRAWGKYITEIGPVDQWRVQITHELTNNDTKGIMSPTLLFSVSAVPPTSLEPVYLFMSTI